jgi:hypothetical protein
MQAKKSAKRSLPCLVSWIEQALEVDDLFTPRNFSQPQDSGQKLMLFDTGPAAAQNDSLEILANNDNVLPARRRG